MTGCDHHNAEQVSDATGDLSEPHLTMHFAWWRCPDCGSEFDEAPPGWEEPFNEPDIGELPMPGVDFVYDPFR